MSMPLSIAIKDWGLFGEGDPSEEHHADRIAYLFQCHAILNQQGNARIQIPHILLQDEVLLGL